MNSCNLAILILILCGIFIATFVNYLQFMSVKFFEGTMITRWSISHMMIFFIIGCLCPNHLEEFMGIGLLWEIIERIIGIISKKETFWTSGGWQGQLLDLIMNFIGYKSSELFYTYFHI